MESSGVTVLILFLVLILGGIPMAYSMILASAVYFFFLNPTVPATVIPQWSIGMVSQSFTLLAVPLFLLAGDLLNTCGMTQRLVAFALAIVGHIRGGIGHAVVVANIIMAGMSGSATADAAGIGSMMIPALREAKFRAPFAAALCASAATIGPIIPPSIPMVIYSSLTGVSLGRLLLAGVFPGLVMGLFLMVDLYFSRESAGTFRERFSWRRALATARDAVLSLIMPLIILGGMFGGVYTPTEGAAVAVAYALFVGVVVYHSLSPAMIFQSLRRTTVITGAVMFIVAAANSLSWIMTAEHLGEVLQGMFMPFRMSPVLTLFMVSLLLLVLGCVMEASAILVLMSPVLAPVAALSGIDPVHFGLVFVLATMIGLVTPPVGMTMFVTCSIADVTVAEFARVAWRPIVALVLSLAVCVVWPKMVLFIPNLVMGK